MLETQPKTHAELLVRAIHADIVNGRLKPGDKLGMSMAQERYKVGLSPLREALSRLTTLGLVTAEGHRGFRVSQVSPTDLMDLIKTMVWIDAIVLKAAIQLGDRDWEADILAAAHRLGASRNSGGQECFSDEEWEEAHKIFHRTLVSACRAPRLLKYRAVLWDDVDRYRRLSSFYENGTRDVDGEHLAMVEAVLARDAERAVQLMTSHLLETARKLLESDPATAHDAGAMMASLRENIDAAMPGDHLLEMA